MPKVSIIVPVYNAQQWLKPCVDSVIAQTVSDWQLILVDDGSTDSSPAICDEYAAADARILTLHKPNGGPSAARNMGVKHASGKYIIFIDADDAVHHDLVSFMLNLRNQSNAKICVAGAVRKLAYQFENIDYKDFKLYSTDEAIKRILYQRKNFLNSVCNIMYDRDLFDGIYLIEGLRYEDLDFFYRILKKTDTVCHSPQITYLYRDNPTSFMNTWSHSRLDVLRVVDNMVKHMEQHESTALQRAAHDRRFSAYFNMFALAAKHGEYDICDRCWPVIREQRAAELTNKKVRLKNKLGALISYLGKSATKAVARLISK